MSSILLNPSMAAASIHRSVVAFPVRGRCNPYCGYILPLLLFTLLAFLLDLAALVISASIPASRTFYALESSFLDVRVSALVLYAVALFLIGLLFILYACNLFNCCDSALTPTLLNLCALLTIAILVPISVIMMVAEYALPESAFDDAVYINTYLISGALGLAASFPLIIVVFFSRFYEFCIGNYKTQKRRVLEASELASQIDGTAAFSGSKTHNFYSV